MAQMVTSNKGKNRASNLQDLHPKPGKNNYRSFRRTVKIIYYKGLGIRFQQPEEIDLTIENIIHWEIKKMHSWRSPNLIIYFESKKFEQPTNLIVNYKDVLRWLKTQL